MEKLFEGQFPFDGQDRMVLQKVVDGHNEEEMARECLPFHLLTSVQREVLQSIAYGQSDKEIAMTYHKSSGTIRTLWLSLGRIGMPFRYKSDSQVNSHSAILALIVDGINYGYLKTKLPESVQELSLAENEVFELRLQGLAHPEIAIKRQVSLDDVGQLSSNAIHKLMGNNFFHAAAIATYLKLHGKWSVCSGKGGKIINL